MTESGSKPALNLYGIAVPRSEAITDGIKAQIENAQYETTEIEAALAIVQPKDRVLEIGAGIGLTGAIIAKHTGADYVLSVEANPDLIPEIETLHRTNRLTNISVRHGAVMAGRQLPPKTKLAIGYNYLGSSIVTAQRRSHGNLAVPVIDFNDLVRSYNPNVLIMDIEGAEEQIIRLGDLTSIRSISLEMHPQIYGFITRFELHQRLRRAGFKPVEKFCSRLCFTGSRE